MKTNNNKLNFTKTVITELNDEQLQALNGGTFTITTVLCAVSVVSVMTSKEIKKLVDQL